MRLIKMTGGLGNQMFIYALFIRMNKIFRNCRIDLSDMIHYHNHNGYEMWNVFDLPHIEFCIWQPLKKVMEFLFFRVILERHQKGSLQAYFQPVFWPLVYFKGFYQSERYFTEVEDEVRKTFSFNTKNASATTFAMLLQIDEDENAVSIHVRRGDYLDAKTWENCGCICQMPYYRNAIDEMQKRIKNPHYYVFSDDMEWVKENLKLPYTDYIDWNHGSDSWQDMMLMSHCKHHIICNSSFSWWGAWLNPRKDKIVLMPELWFKNNDNPYIYPEKWIKIKISRSHE